MNGKEQKERQTAVAILERKLKALEDAVADAYQTEVGARQAEQEQIKSIFAEMLDAETQFRKRAVMEAEGRSRDLVALNMGLLSEVFATFLKLVWWKRLLWNIVGIKVFLWFPTPPISARRSPATPMDSGQNQKATADATTDETKRKQAASMGVKP